MAVKRLWRSGSLGFVFFLLATGAGAAENRVVLPIETTARQAVMIDVTTNTILLDKKAEERMPTSSMSKMMTMYLVFEALQQGKIKLDDEVPISAAAWRKEGSRMFANVGSKVKVEDLIRGVVIQSGNDASVALAEAVAGTEEIFARRMNEKAVQLGMTNSHFVNATGLPDPQHYATPLDLARLGIALHRDFPQHYHYFSEKEFVFNKIKQGNRNPLLYRNIGADGIKTGHAEAAGFGLTAAVERNGRRIVLVVNGLKDMQERADEPARLIEHGYHEFANYSLFKAGQEVGQAKVWLGQQPKVALVPANDVVLTLPVTGRDKMKVSVEYQEPLLAPLQKGQPAGKIVIAVPSLEPVNIPLQVAADVPKLGFFAAMLEKLRVMFGGAA